MTQLIVLLAGFIPFRRIYPPNFLGRMGWQTDFYLEGRDPNPFYDGKERRTSSF